MNMYDMPPIIKIEQPTPIKVKADLPIKVKADLPNNNIKTNALILSIDSANYDADQNIAHITMSEAFKKSGIVRRYKGDTILLTYKNEPTDNKNCPKVNVPISDIGRDINFSDDIVTIHISNIQQDIADKISEHLCIFVNANTVRAVSAIVFPPPKIDKDPYNHLNR